MTKKQFKHESDEYIPIVNSLTEDELRPKWLPDDEVLLFFDNPLNKNKKIPKGVKIGTLTKEEFIKYQKEGRIPKKYKIEDWI